jgi:hypothetical protein
VHRRGGGNAAARGLLIGQTGAAQCRLLGVGEAKRTWPAAVVLALWSWPNCLMHGTSDFGLTQVRHQPQGPCLQEVGPGAGAISDKHYCYCQCQYYILLPALGAGR